MPACQGGLRLILCSGSRNTWDRREGRGHECAATGRQAACVRLGVALPGSLYACLTARGDVLFELADALLRADGPVTSPVDLTLVAEHRRWHGAMYDALNRGPTDTARLGRLLAALAQPKAAGGRLVTAVDVTNWLRPDAPWVRNGTLRLRKGQAETRTSGQ